MSKKKVFKEAAEALERGLSMSHADRMKRAKDMGFDTKKTYYHGTTAGPFEEFDPSLSNTPGVAAFFTPNKGFAEKFAHDPYYNQRGVVPEGNEDPHAFEVFLNAQNPFDYSNVEHVTKLVDSLSPKELKEINAALMDGTLTRDKLQSQIFDGSFGILETPTVLKKLKSMGFDSMHIREDGVKNLAVFKPNQIRSVNAAFDPKKKKSGNILAGGAGAGLLTAAALSGEEAEASPKLMEQALLNMEKGARLGRAKDMGFDTGKTWYHGTNVPIEQFDPQKAGAVWGKMDLPPATFFSDNPRIASDFAGKAGDAVNSRISHEKANAFFDLEESLSKKIGEPAISTRIVDGQQIFSEKLSPQEIEQLKQLDQARLAAANDLWEGKEAFGQNVIPTHLKYKNPLEIDMQGQDFNPRTDILEAKRKGHDAVIFKNARDNAEGRTGTTVAVFEPDQIRSTNAAFDPAKKSSGNILDFQGSLKNPIGTGVGDVVSKGLDYVDRATGRPIRAGVKALVEGENPLTAAKDAITGESQDVTGEEMVEALMRYAQPSLGFPTPTGEKEFPLAAPIGAAAEFALDPTNVTPVGLMRKGAKAGKLMRGLLK